MRCICACVFVDVCDVCVMRVCMTWYDALRPVGASACTGLPMLGFVRMTTRCSW